MRPSSSLIQGLPQVVLVRLHRAGRLALCGGLWTTLEAIHATSFHARALRLDEMPSWGMRSDLWVFCFQIPCILGLLIRIIVLGIPSYRKIAKEPLPFDFEQVIENGFRRNLPLLTGIACAFYGMSLALAAYVLTFGAFCLHAIWVGLPLACTVTLLLAVLWTPHRCAKGMAMIGLGMCIVQRVLVLLVFEDPFGMWESPLKYRLLDMFRSVLHTGVGSAGLIVLLCALSWMYQVCVTRAEEG